MKSAKWALIAVGISAAAAAAVLWFFSNYIWIGGSFYSRSSEVLDLRGKDISIERYESLRAECPSSEILWDIPFQGKTYAPDTEEVRLIYMAPESLKALEYLPNVKTIHAEDCRDYDGLMEFQRENPQLDVQFLVHLADSVYDRSVEQLEVEAADLPELEEKMEFLPLLNMVEIEGVVEDTAAVKELQAAHPEIDFRWAVEIGGRLIRYTDTEADLSGVSLANVLGLEADLRMLPNLEKINLCRTGLSEKKIRKMVEDFPQVTFVWEMDVCSHVFRTDAEEIDLSGTPVTNVPELEEKLQYFTNLKKVIMSGCGISDADMDALNRRHEDIRFVWTVYIGGLHVRTDDTTFMPAKYQTTVEWKQLYPLRYCTDMEVIDLGHMWVVDISWAAFMPNLRFLILGETSVEDISPLTGLTNLVYLELFSVPVTDYSPLVTCTGLEDLNLGWTFGDPEPIAKMTWLKNLSWCGCDNPRYPSQRAVDLLPDALPNTRVDLYAPHPGGNWWRFLDNYYVMRDLLGMPYLNQDGKL